ncbi:MAG: hypothetical protein V3T72_20515 [Thermoanaerobaculia bacterium]
MMESLLDLHNAHLDGLDAFREGRATGAMATSGRPRTRQRVVSHGEYATASI